MTHRTDETLDSTDVDSAARVGSVLKDTYELVGFLGEGGFGSVYRGVQHPIDRSVAVKILDLPQRGARKRFLMEAKVVASLTHPAAVTIYDYGTTDDGCPFMVMEFLDGWDLEVELQKGPISPARLAKLLPDVLDALSQAHRQGLVHRDLKPSNLFVVDPGDDEKLKLLDFGIAGFADATGERPADGMRLTAQGGIVGTPQYLAPEYIRDQTVSPALDVYQMGLVIAEALSGTPAVNEPSLISCAQKHLSGELSISAQTLATPGFGPIIAVATATEPEDRYPDAGAMLAALREAREAGGLPETTAQRQAPPAGGRVPTVSEAVVGGQRTVFESAETLAPETEGPSPPHATPTPNPSAPQTDPAPNAAATDPTAPSETPAPPPNALRLPSESKPPPPSSGSSAGSVAAVTVVTVVAVLTVCVAVAVAAVSWYVGKSNERDPPPPDVVVSDDGRPEPAALPTGIDGQWQMTTEVLGSHRHGVGVQGFYEMAVRPDHSEARLVKTGYTNRSFKRSKYQKGSATLLAMDGAYTLHPTLRGPRSELDMTFVIMPYGDGLTGYWQYRGDSYDKAGMWGVLAASRGDRPSNPNAEDQPCLVSCLIRQQAQRPASAPQTSFCAVECEGGR